MKLVTTEEMLNLEQQAVRAGTSVETLMENAGLGLAQHIRKLMGTVKGRRIVVLAGPGNNGGDGLVAARHLHDWDADVRVYLLAKRRDDDGNYMQLVKRELDMTDAKDDPTFVTLERFLSDAELVVDALLGTGRLRPIEANLAGILDRVRAARNRPLTTSSGGRGATTLRQPPRLIAVDIPTGVDADTGAVDTHCVPADVTVTLGYSKIGLHTLPGSEYAGQVEVVDIGLPPVATDALKVELMTPESVARMLPLRPLNANKATFGRVLVVAGSENYTGAVHLAAAGAGRVGAGIVTIACPRSIQGMIAASTIEATYLPLPEKDGAIAEKAAPYILSLIRDFDVMLLGPGIGRQSGTMAFVRTLLFALKPEMRLTVVLDADGLNILSGTPNWATQVNVPMVLTPHPGELRRLTGHEVSEIQERRLEIARVHAAEWKQTVVLKGAHTIVSSPDGRTAIAPFANPALATAGTGDVLSGAVAGFLAQRLSPYAASTCAAYVHGAAGERLRETLGDAGVLAGDLLPELPRVIKSLKKGAF